MQTKRINLRLEGAKVDEAVHSFLMALEINNSFLVYDGDGRLTGVVVLEKAVSPPIAESLSDEEARKLAYRELTTAERNSILRDFARWSELTDEEQKSIHERLKTIPPSRVRDQIIKEYVRQVLEIIDSEEENPSGGPVSFVVAIRSEPPSLLLP